MGVQDEWTIEFSEIIIYDNQVNGKKTQLNNLIMNNYKSLVFILIKLRYTKFEKWEQLKRGI